MTKKYGTIGISNLYEKIKVKKGEKKWKIIEKQKESQKIN